jgi:hypothetical protein
MKKLSEQDALTLADLANRNGFGAIASELKRLEGATRSAGRPADLILNTAILWAHIEFLKLHRVAGKKQKLKLACELLAGYLDRFTVGARSKSATTLMNIYKRAPKEARAEPMIAAVMNDAFRVLSRHLKRSPQKIPIPYLIEGKVAGWKFPTIDPNQYGDDCDAIGSRGLTYEAVFSLVVTPKK